jgi:hypothetical protein
MAMEARRVVFEEEYDPSYLIDFVIAGPYV